MSEHLFKLKKDGKTVGYMCIKDGCVSTCSDPWDTAHLFITKDKNGKDVFKDDEVLVYRGKKNIGEGYVDFNERFLWWVVNNSNQDDDRESPQDWSQLSLCDVDIELIEEKEDE